MAEARISATHIKKNMKNSGSLAIVIVVGIAILVTLHQQGRLFSPSSDSSKNGNVSQISQKTSVQTKSKETSDGATSPYKDRVGLTSVKDPGTFAGIEYITIKSSSKDPVVLTGWSVSSTVTGNKIFIGNASSFPEILPEGPITLQKSDKVVLVSGKSPVGFSFRINECTGYYEDKHNFNPSLPLQCPAPEDEEFLPEKIDDSDKCMDYIESFSTCEIPPKKLPNMSGICEGYIAQTMSYGACANNHSGDKNFFKQEWRVFLNNKFPLWHKEKDVLRLWDAQGRLVDSYEYEFEDWDD